MQRRKGAAAEREFAHIMGAELGMKFDRQLSQSRDGGCDLVMSGFAVECKRHESNPLRAWWAQACISAKALGLMPAVAFRRSYQPWLVIVPVDWYAGGKQLEWDSCAILTVPAFAFACRETMGRLDEPKPFR
jgi:hypothetical protein